MKNQKQNTNSPNNTKRNRMKSKIFNTDQIRAIQDGRMTQFMQVVKPHPANKGIWTPEECEGLYHTYIDWIDDDTDRKHKPEWLGLIDGDFQCALGQCPLGRVGDILYCRETWWGGYELNDNDHITEGTPLRYWYFADGRDARPGDMSDSKCYHLFGGDKSDWPAWRSPATMPREAARLFLRITNIRIMRGGELTEQDALDQGYECIDKELCPALVLLKTNLYDKHDIDGLEKYFWVIDFTKTDKP